MRFDSYKRNLKLKHNGKKVALNFEYEYSVDGSTEEGEFTTDTDISTDGSIPEDGELFLSVAEPETEELLKKFH